MRFRTTLIKGERKNVVGIVVPADVVEAFGAGKRPPVTVTINGYSYRGSVAVMGGEYLVGVSAEHRAKAEVAGGDTVEVELALDAAPRTIETPADLAEALNQSGAAAGFEALAFSHRKEHVRAIEEAKTPETRRRRIESTVRKVLAGGR